MKLNLNRPIVFFDIEATGLNIATDRIVELCYIKLLPDGSQEERTLRFNPGIHISAEATAVNGITDADVAHEPHFRDLAHELEGVFAGCDLAGFNSNSFDIPMLVEEFIRAGINFDITGCKFVDVQNIFHKMEQRNLTAAYRFYCGKELENSHSANADTRATYEVLKSQLDRYPSLQNDVDYLAAFSTQNKNVDLAGRFVYNEKNEVVFNFGKYKGRSVKEVLKVDSGYYGWMMNGDFPQDTKNVLTKIKLQSK